jgi:hypothetical protein
VTTYRAKTGRTKMEQNDATAEAYTNHLFISEFLMEQLKVMKIEDLLNRYGEILVMKAELTPNRGQ